MHLRAQEVSFHIKRKTLIDSISLHTENKGIVGLLGPNGSGKSTFLKTIYRVFKPQSGLIQMGDWDVWDISPKTLFQQLAVVSQETYNHELEFTTIEIVRMGRYPFQGAFDRNTTQDGLIVEEALKKVGLWEFRNHTFMSLSGGEKQRTLIARALAQQPRFLLLDEPTNHLDIHYQLEILDLLKGLNIGVLAALHDLNLASLYCDYLYVLQAGQVVAEGTPEQVLTPAIIQKIYHVRSEVTRHPHTGKLHITFLPSV